MAAKPGSNPYRTPGELPPEPPVDWSKHLISLQVRKKQRRGRPLPSKDAAGSQSRTNPGTPDSRRILSSLLPSRMANDAPDGGAMAITVEISIVPPSQSEPGPVISINWELPMTREAAMAAAPVAEHFDELKAAHGHCVGWLYALAEKRASPADRRAARDHLQELSRLLTDTPLHVVVIGYRGFKVRLAESVPLLLELCAKLDSWTDGPPPDQIADLARHCLRAFGWRDPSL